MAFDENSFMQVKRRIRENIGQLVILDRDMDFRRYAHYSNLDHSNHRFAGVIEAPGFAETTHKRYGNLVPMEFVVGYITVGFSLNLSGEGAPLRTPMPRVLLHDVSNMDLGLFPKDFDKDQDPLQYETTIVRSFNLAIGDDEVMKFLAEKYSIAPDIMLSTIKKALKSGVHYNRKNPRYDFDDRFIVAPACNPEAGRRLHA